MATLLSFTARGLTIGRVGPPVTGTAEIVILPCIRRERMDGSAAVFAANADDLPTQRQA